LLSPIPALLEESLFQELASAVLEKVWIEGGGNPRGYTGCVLLTNPHHGSGLASMWGQVYLVQLKRTDPGAWEVGTPGERVPETEEPVVPDTDRVYTTQQMAQAWKAIGRPVKEDDVPLSVDPDDSTLF
jgi:hypothetical protein